MVEVKNLTKFYGSIKAVDDISYDNRLPFFNKRYCYH